MQTRMLSLFSVTCIFALISISESSTSCVVSENKTEDAKFHLVYEWKYINFTWPSYENYKDAVSSKLYIPENNVILGVKYYKGKFYLALPKIRPGSPVTIGFISEESTNGAVNPLLTPFPNWETHLTDDCDKNLQNLQSFEIDNDGIMWIIDGRRIDRTPKKCPPKIVLVDLNKSGLVLQSYIVPDSVCSHENCSMNDLVLDDTEGGFAYITDSSSTDPGLIIYSRRKNQSWKVRDQIMFAEPSAMNFTSHGILHSGRNNVNGIALAQKSKVLDEDRTLFFTALSAFTMYSINSRIIRNESLATSSNVGNFIKNVGNKSAQSAGMIVDSEGFLFYGIITQDAVLRWDTKKPISSAKVVEKNPDLMPWPDSYTFDNQGYLYLIASNVDRFAAGKLSTDNNNFKLSKLYTGTCSYQIF